MGSRLEKNSAAVRKRLASHEFTDETGEEYEASEFGGFGDYFRRKQVKLQNLDVELRAAAKDKPQIFKGVVAHVTGYTQPPLHVLHKELVQHGAGFLQYLDGKTSATHIIASAMPPKKSVDFSKYRVVKPAWVMDSIQAGRLLPWSNYRVLDDGPRQKTIRFDGGKMLSQAAQKTPAGYREQTQSSFYTSQFQSQKPTGRLSSQGSSSPFQPNSAGKPSAAELDIIDDFDDMDLDLLIEEPTNPPQGIQAFGVSAADRPPPHADDKSGEVTSHPVPEPETKPKPPALEKPLTSEEHNARLLADPKIRKSSTANPDFLKQYYSESRLHHLSTWKAELKSRLQSLAAQKAPAPKATKRKPGSRRYVMHVDFDSFFCAVSLKQAPEYRDKPAVVAHGTGSGSEIASCNYPARKFGVKNGMWMKRAQELCPDLKILPYDFPAYEEASRQFYDAIIDVGGVVQSVSIDEALVDITDIVLSDAGSEGVGVNEGSVWREQEKADEIASNLRAEIKKKTDCNVSVGIGGNILLAKIALRKAKPAGQYQIKPEEVLDLLSNLRVEDLPGVAYSIGGKLEEIGVRLVRDLRQTPKERLVSLLGPKTGEKLWDYARGIDHAEVGEQPIRKSVSADVNWGIRFVSQEEAEEFVRNLCKELERRLLNEGVKGKHLTMKIMRRALDAPLDPPKHLGHGKCDTFNKSVAFGIATNDAGLIGKEAVAILRSYRFSPGDLRGLGVQMTKLEPLKPTAASGGSQRKLNFGNWNAVSSAKRQQLTEPIDEDTSTDKNDRPSGQEVEQDPITVDPLTPRKPKVHPALALARANAADSKANSPLNIAGTQFIVPSNPDPAVLAELPQDIRSRLVRQASKRPLPPAPAPAPSTTAGPSREASPSVSFKANSRSHSPAVAQATTDDDNEDDDIPSDVDPEVFCALPEEMKAEVRASYGGGRRKRKPHGGAAAAAARGGHQTVLPQSPRKDRVIYRPRERATTTRRGAGAAGGGIGSLFGRARERAVPAAAAPAQQQGPRQTTFAPAGAVAAADAELVADLDPDVLAELPEDVRREVVEDHRRRRMAQRSGLSYPPPFPAPPAGAAARRTGGSAGRPAQTAAARLKFPAKPAKVGFTQARLTSLGEIKEMVGAWHEATKEEGPHRDDVAVFGRFVKRIVTEERNMEKARVLVKWLEWVVEDDEGGGGEGEEGKVEEGEKVGKESWREAVGLVKGAVQEGMRERGLGMMEFG